MQDFIADAKAKPGSISFGSVGIGSAVHISAEKFRLAAGIEATHVPYRGGAEVIADILGGRIDFYFCAARHRAAADPRRPGARASGVDAAARRPICPTCRRRLRPA